jgi:hypothetical protein
MQSPREWQSCLEPNETIEASQPDQARPLKQIQDRHDARGAKICSQSLLALSAPWRFTPAWSLIRSNGLIA